MEKSHLPFLSNDMSRGFDSCTCVFFCHRSHDHTSHYSFVNLEPLPPTLRISSTPARLTPTTGLCTTARIRGQDRHFVDWYGHVCNLRGVKPRRIARRALVGKNRLQTTSDTFGSLSSTTTLRSRRSIDNNFRWAAVPARRGTSPRAASVLGSHIRCVVFVLLSAAQIPKALFLPTSLPTSLCFATRKTSPPTAPPPCALYHLEPVPPHYATPTPHHTSPRSDPPRCEALRAALPCNMQHPRTRARIPSP